MRVKAQVVGTTQSVTTNIKVDTLGLAADVSAWQQTVDWAKVATVCPVGMAKASEGLDFSDPFFSASRVNSMRANVRPALYHFARPDNRPNPTQAATECDFFVDTVLAAGGNFVGFPDWRYGADGFLGVLDFEKSSGTYANGAPFFNPDWAVAWADRFKVRTGARPMLYGYGQSINPCVPYLDHFSSVWLSAFVPDWTIYWNGPESAVTFWQWTNVATVPGVQTPCDQSYYMKGSVA